MKNPLDSLTGTIIAGVIITIALYFRGSRDSAAGRGVAWIG